MSQISEKPTSESSPFPPAPPGGSSDPLAWKKLPDVLKTVTQTERLTSEEKSGLEELLRRGDIDVKSIVEKSVSLDDLIAKLLGFIRTPQPVEKVPEDSEKFEIAIKKISSNKNLKVAVKTLQKTLQALQKKPTDLANRKLRLDNIVIKKYVVGVEGAQDFLEAVGYRATEAGGKKFLEIEPDKVDMPKLSRAIDLLTQKLKDIETAEKAPPSTIEKPRIICVGGCGFFGDEKTENMCSLCYKKKYDIKTSSPPSSEPISLCIKGCGFYGMSKFKGMCSVCYGKDSSTRRKELKRRWRIAMTKIRAVRRFKLNLRPVQKNKSKCWKCPRKVGITGIECRCGYIFCGEHRYASEHDCPYDFKQAHQKKLLKDNIKVLAKKLDKIDSDGE